MTLSIITINYNGIAYTRKFLDSLKPFMQDDWEVIVVDNASRQDEASLLRQEYPWIKCIQSTENVGFSGGNNIGVDSAQGEYLFFINNDVLISSDCFSPLLQKLQSDKGIGAISPRIKNLDGTYNYTGCAPLDRYLMRIHYRTKLIPEEQKSEETPLIHGAAVMMPASALHSIGGWPEIYFLYSEEIDLSLHLKRKGYKLWYEPKAELLHIGSATVGKKSAMNCYYNSRNRLLLYSRNLSGWQKIYALTYHLCLTVPHNSLQYLKRRETSLLKAYLEGVKDFLKGRFGKK